MMTAVSNQQRKRIHPHKFIMWIALGSIVMMFAGFTSAYVVKRNQSNWLEFSLPPAFWFSTITILLSSVTVHLALKSFKARDMMRYRRLIAITGALGIIFIVLQCIGFSYLEDHGVKLIGSNSNPAASFLGVITGVHMLHVSGGVIAIIVMGVRAYSATRKNYSSVSVEIVNTYWHFVDGLWIYLFLFFNWLSV
jgi:cytochrome c oxidase subunit 3